MSNGPPKRDPTVTAVTPKIRILLVDDHHVVRMGLRALVASQTDMEVIAEGASGEEAVAAFEQWKPDVTLMDLRLPKMSGPQAIAEIRSRHPDARIIVITTYDGDEDVYRAVHAGARGYILKDTFPDAMLEAIRHVHAGKLLLPPELVMRLAERLSTPALSAREIQVLDLVAKGLSNKEIGATLFVSEAAIKNHLQRLFRKLGVADRTEAVMLAVQRGIISLS
jgi:two-component system, NarL family, response regulator